MSVPIVAVPGNPGFSTFSPTNLTDSSSSSGSSLTQDHTSLSAELTSLFSPLPPFHPVLLPVGTSSLKTPGAPPPLSKNVSAAGDKKTGRRVEKAAGGKLRTCAACRIRRVKCERDPGNTDCKKCIDRNLQCVPMPVVSRAPRKKIDHPTTTNDAASPDDESSSQKRQRRDSTTLGELSSHSVTAQLVITELESALSESLLGLYLALPQGRLAILEDATHFRATFHAANSRMHELDAQNQALLAIILALTARVSDHHLLVGSNKPSLQLLDTMALRGEDLSVWGKHREDACEALTKKAIRLADEAEIWRTPTLINVNILLLLEGLSGEIGTRSRPYGDAYMSHIRVLLEEDDTGTTKDRLKSSGIAFVCYMKDAAHSAWSGRQSFIDREDFQELLYGTPLPTLRTAIQTSRLTITTDGSPDQYRSLLLSFMLHLSDISRDFPARLNGVGALRRPLNVTLVRHLVERLDYALIGALRLEEVALESFGDIQTCSPANLRWWSSIRTLRANRAGLVIRIKNFIGQRLDVQKVAGGGDDGTTEYWMKLADLYHEVSPKAFEAAREMCLMIRRSLDTGISFGVVAGARYSLARLANWFSVLLDTLTEEEGGPKGFTFIEKLLDLRCVLRALRSIGWSFENIARSIPWIEYEISMVEHRQALYNQQQLFTSQIFDFGGTADNVAVPSEAELDNLVGKIEANLCRAERAILPTAAPGGGSLEETLKGRDDILIRMLGSLLG